MEKKTNHTRTIISVAIVICVCIFFAILFLRKTKNPDIDIMEKFESENFIRAIDEKGDVFARCEGKMLGAIVPHHMIGGKFIADVFSQASNIDTVVLIGPNHYEKGNSSIITANSDWETAKGTVQADGDFISGLISKNIALAQNEIIGDDHSIGNILPFIAYYLPKTKVVPIILKRNVSEDEFKNLLQYLADQKKTKKMLIVGSVDFSHYLSEQESEKKDAETIKAIEDKNYSLIGSFHNDNLDSPPTVNAMLKVMDMFGSNKMLWRNSNSFKVMGGDINNTTSYFELVFCGNK